MADDRSTETAWIAEFFPDGQSWPAAPTAAQLATLPGCAAVYLLLDQHGAPVLVASTQHLRRISLARLTSSEERRRTRADLSEIVRQVRWRAVIHAFEARWRYYQAARRLHPRDYRRRVAFGPAWFLHAAWADVPELGVSERIHEDAGEFIGPWPTRAAAQQALDGLIDLFELCRYPEEVRRAPHGRRCAYAEMGRCDAPCDGAVPLASYRERCRAAWTFAADGPAAWCAAAQQQMAEHARALRFERAGLLKEQLAFARRWQRDWQPFVRPAEALAVVLVLPATRRKAWKLFYFRGGELLDGPLVPERRLMPDAPAWFAQARQVPPVPLEPRVRTEQTWLVSHLLFHHESAGGLVRVEPLCDAELGDALARLSARRAAQATAPADAEPPGE